MTPNATQPAWLIDSSIYVFKSWYTWPDKLVDPAGRPVQATLGFIDFVYRLLINEMPGKIAFAFDESLETSHRREIYPDYKANRLPAPESLRFQFRRSREFLRAFGLYEAASTSYEADDLIGTWAKALRKKAIPVNIITADKDLAQLVHEHDHWWEYQQNKKLDQNAIEKKFKAAPHQIADQLAIAGDKSDNIPGVPGIGMATAGKLLKRFDNLENLLASIDQIATMQIRGAARIQSLIQEHQDLIRLSRKLTGVCCDIESVDPAIFSYRGIDEAAFSALSENLGLSADQRQKWLKLATKLTTDL